MKEVMLPSGAISAKDLNLFMLLDDPAKVAEIIEEFYQVNKMITNF
jgi:predicted Rossmann-fold nucleotide-binding protein